MSHYVNSEGLSRKTWKGNDENGIPLGYNDENLKKRRQTYNTSNLNNLVKRGKANTTLKNTGKVPKFKFEPDKLFTTNGFVQPNTGDTLKTRLNTFEQNFLKRLYTVYQNATLKQTPLNLNAYAIQLKTEENESEAILLYNELIVLYILLCIDCIKRLLSDNKEVIVKIYTNIVRVEDPDNAARHLIKLVPWLLLTALFLGSMATPAAPLAGGWAALIGSFTMSGALLEVGPGTGLFDNFAYFFVPLRHASNVGHRNSYIEKGNLIQLFLTMNELMFSSENKVPITRVKDKLKYWGLLQTQVDYMFVSGQINQEKKRDKKFIKNYLVDIMKLCVYSDTNNDFTLAPNGALANEDLLDVVYPNQVNLLEIAYPNTPGATGGTRRKLKKKLQLRKRYTGRK